MQLVLQPPPKPASAGLHCGGRVGAAGSGLGSGVGSGVVVVVMVVVMVVEVVGHVGVIVFVSVEVYPGSVIVVCT
jgi:hypothetical protein